MNIEEALENLDQLEDESIYRDDSREYAENQEIIEASLLCVGRKALC